MSKSWYVVYVSTGTEKRVLASIKERFVNSSCPDSLGEVLVPTEEIVEMRAGQKRKSERKFFPGYVLVELDLTNDAWHIVKNTPNVLKFVGGASGKPAPLDRVAAKKLLNQIEERNECETPKVVYQPGESVRITNGPFNDFNGTVEVVNYEKNRLQVIVLILGRQTPVELEFSQVEKC